MKGERASPLLAATAAATAPPRLLPLPHSNMLRVARQLRAGATRRLRVGATVAVAGAASAVAAAAALAEPAQPQPTTSSGRWAWPAGAAVAASLDGAGRQYSREEVARHNTAEDCWIVIGDRVYDVTAWLARHPGRPAPILALAGMDATVQFRHFHSKEVFAEYAGEFEIGQVVGGALATEDNAAARWHEGSTEVFDYVVVGAGSAGCLMTRRLCQAGFSVCLLEAGGSIAEDTNDSVNDPMKYGAAFGTSLNWGHATVAQPGAGGRHIRCTRGRGVGGCSLVNGMLYNRGAREIYDIGWAHAAVAAVPPLPQQSESAEWPWSAELCLPYFKVRGKRSLLRRFLLV
jgi:cytochrome b involved in lipid metabolism